MRKGIELTKLIAVHGKVLQAKSQPMAAHPSASRKIGPSRSIHIAHRRVAPAQVMVLFTVLAIVCGCRASEKTTPAPPRPNVIFISLDTVRWDALGVHNPSMKDVTPNIDAFASESVVFRNAFAPVPHTAISHASMFTGLYPDVHGVRGKKPVLSSDLVSLPQLLHGAGYQTAAIFSVAWFKKGTGFERGYDTYTWVKQNRSFVFGDRVNAEVETVLPALVEQARPFFLFVHNFDAHSDPPSQNLPYYSPPEFRKNAPHAFRGADAQDAASREFCLEPKVCATKFLLAVDRASIELSKEKIQTIKSLYDDGIRYVDYEFGQLLGILKRYEVFEDALIIVLSDHGEEFREHGSFSHNQVYEESVRIPLFIRFPGAQHAGRDLRTLAETIDLLPTILEYVNIPLPEGVQGESLLPHLQGDGPPKTEAFLQHKHYPSIYAVRTERFKLILDVDSKDIELYDLEADPNERLDLSETNRELARELARRVVAHVSENQQLALARAAEGQGLEGFSEQEIESLKALGYLQGPAAAGEKNAYVMGIIHHIVTR